MDLKSLVAITAMTHTQLKKGIMGRPGLDAAQYLVDFTGIPVTAQEAMSAMEKRQEELFRQVR